MDFISDLPDSYSAFLEPKDPMVYGLQAYNSLADKPSHPVQHIQKTQFQLEQQLKDNMLRGIYGKHFVEGLAYERNQIAKLHAQGHQSSHISLEIAMNKHATVEPEDYMSLPQHQPRVERQDIHTQMNNRHTQLGQ